jgi:hypothetical protein
MSTKIILLLIAVIIAICTLQATQITKSERANFSTYSSSYKTYSTPLAYRDPVTSSQGVVYVGGKVAPTTILTTEQLKIQDTQGCKACHKNW